MKANSLVLDPEMADQLGDCQPGEEKQVTLTIKVDKHDDTGLSGTVTEVQPYDEEDTQDSGADEESEGEPGMGSPAMKKAMAGE